MGLKQLYKKYFKDSSKTALGKPLRKEYLPHVTLKQTWEPLVHRASLLLAPLFFGPQPVHDSIQAYVQDLYNLTWL